MIENSYNAGPVTGGVVTGGERSAGGEGRSSGDMKQQDTFVGWDFDHVWTLDEGVDYPELHGLERPLP